jgi:hypothetical protein
MVRQFDASHVEPEQHIIGCAEEAHVRTDWAGAKDPERRESGLLRLREKHSLIIPVYRTKAAYKSPRVTRFSWEKAQFRNGKALVIL